MGQIGDLRRKGDEVLEWENGMLAMMRSIWWWWFGEWGSVEVPVMGGNDGSGLAMVELVLRRLGEIATHIKM